MCGSRVRQYMRVSRVRRSLPLDFFRMILDLYMKICVHFAFTSHRVWCSLA